GLLRQQRLRMLAAGGETLLVSHSAWQRFDASLVAAATEYHRQFPLRRGMPRSEARGRLQRLLPSATLPVRAFNLLLDGLIQSGGVGGDDVSLRLPAFRPLLTPVQQQRVERLLAAFAAAPSSPPIVQEVLQRLGQERELLEYLVDTGQLVWLGSEVLLRSEECAAQIRHVVAHLQAKGSVTLAEVRDLLQTSRKYAQALLEEMDARRITQRVGEGRVLVADD
ncbi:MAG: SelB C-terminal domain-containing protein, partial [Caldilinea sp.]